MAFEVGWHLKALSDLDALANFIARDSRLHASITVRRFFEFADEIGEMPFAGAVVPERHIAAYRQRPLFAYRLIYRVDPERVTMMAIVHAARMMPGEVSGRVGYRRARPKRRW